MDIKMKEMICILVICANYIGFTLSADRKRRHSKLKKGAPNRKWWSKPSRMHLGVIQVVGVLWRPIAIEHGLQLISNAVAVGGLTRSDQRHTAGVDKVVGRPVRRADECMRIAHHKLGMIDPSERNAFLARIGVRHFEQAHFQIALSPGHLAQLVQRGQVLQDIVTSVFPVAEQKSHAHTSRHDGRPQRRIDAIPVRVSIAVQEHRRVIHHGQVQEFVRSIHDGQQSFQIIGSAGRTKRGGRTAQKHFASSSVHQDRHRRVQIVRRRNGWRKPVRQLLLAAQQPVDFENFAQIIRQQRTAVRHDTLIQARIARQHTRYFSFEIFSQNFFPAHRFLWLESTIASPCWHCPRKTCHRQKSSSWCATHRLLKSKIGRHCQPID